MNGRSLMLAAVALAFPAVGAIAPAADAAEDWPTKPLTMVVGFGVGGSADRTARAIAPSLGEELGQPIQVVNREGAGSQLAASYVLAQPDDCYTIFASALSPYLATSILTGGAPYTLEDFAFINAQWTDWDIIAANREGPYDTLPQLLKAIEENPGEVKVSLVFGSSGQLTTLLLLDTFGIPHDNLNMVNYDSGGAARTAVAGGQVDFTILGGEGSRGIKEFITPLAVVRKQPHENWDAPAVNKALEPTGETIPIVVGSMRGLAVDKDCKEKHPGRFQELVQAYQSVLEDEELQASLAEGGIGGEWLGPQETTSQIAGMYDIFARYGDVLSN